MTEKALLAAFDKKTNAALAKEECEELQQWELEIETLKEKIKQHALTVAYEEAADDYVIAMNDLSEIWRHNKINEIEMDGRTITMKQSNSLRPTVEMLKRYVSEDVMEKMRKECSEKAKPEFKIVLKQDTEAPLKRLKRR